MLTPSPTVAESLDSVTCVSVEKVDAIDLSDVWVADDSLIVPLLVVGFISIFATMVSDAQPGVLQPTSELVEPVIIEVTAQTVWLRVDDVSLGDDDGLSEGT